MWQEKSNKLKSEEKFTRDQKIFQNFQRSLTHPPQNDFVAGEVKYWHKPNQLLLDFDKEPPVFPVLLAGIRKLHLHPISISYQRSTKNWHVIVELKERMSIMGVVFCQLFLGSDPWRERWTFLHVEQYGRRDKFVQVLFERKVNL